MESLGPSRKALKRQKKDEAWQAKKEVMKQQRKEKRKQKKVEKRSLIEAGIVEPRRRIKHEDQIPSNVRVILDMSFEHLMSEKDFKSAVKQIGFCYGQNRNAKHPMRLSLTSMNERTKSFLLAQCPHYENWKNIEITEAHFKTLYPSEDVVYLTADSQNVLDTLEDTKCYVIGGIVDHNQHKGLCQSWADKEGFKTAALPIGNFMQLASRKVLTINQVMEIMSKFVETKDWQLSFQEVIPQRKQISLPASCTDSESEPSSLDRKRKRDIEDVDCALISDVETASKSILQGAGGADPSENLRNAK